MSTDNTGIDTRTEVPDNMLLPASQSQNNYYVAGAFMVRDLQTTFSIGNGQISVLNGIGFENVRLNADQQYVFFTRLYSSEIVSYIYAGERDGESEGGGGGRIGEGGRGRGSEGRERMKERRGRWIGADSVYILVCIKD